MINSKWQYLSIGIVESIGLSIKLLANSQNLQTIHIGIATAFLILCSLALLFLIRQRHFASSERTHERAILITQLPRVIIFGNLSEGFSILMILATLTQVSLITKNKQDVQLFINLCFLSLTISNLFTWEQGASQPYHQLILCLVVILYLNVSLQFYLQHGIEEKKHNQQSLELSNKTVTLQVEDPILNESPYFAKHRPIDTILRAFPLLIRKKLLVISQGDQPMQHNLPLQQLKPAQGKSLENETIPLLLLQTSFTKLSPNLELLFQQYSGHVRIKDNLNSNNLDFQQQDQFDQQLEQPTLRSDSLILQEIVQLLSIAHNQEGLDANMYLLEGGTNNVLNLSGFSFLLYFVKVDCASTMVVQLKYKPMVQSNKDILNNLVSSLSHEFGTFLNLLSTLSEQGEQDPNIQQHIRIAYFKPMLINSQLLNLMLSSLRDQMFLYQNSLLLKIDYFNIIDALTSLVEYYTGTVQKRGIQCIIDNQLPNQHQLVCNDEQRVKQIFFQLMSNAVRFTRNGNITITIGNLSYHHFNGVEITVKDEGLGMSQLEQEKLKSLLKVDDHGEKISIHSVGCGLGLRTADKLALKISGNFHKGVQFESNEGIGSSFSFCIENVDVASSSSFESNKQVRSRGITKVKYISKEQYIEQTPLFTQIMKNDSRQLIRNRSISKVDQKRNHSQIHIHSLILDHPRNLSCENREEEHSHLVNAVPVNDPKFQDQIIKYALDQNCCSKVLIIDDEYFNIMALQLTLNRRFKASSDSSFNGKEALEKIQERKMAPCSKCGNGGYIIYFIDVNMPVMDGFQTVKAIKQKIQNGEIQRGICIANTGFVDIETKVKCFEYGMDYYITKPIKVESIYQFILSVYPNA